MILGDTYTRRCGCCNVKTGKPTWNDPFEPARVARGVARMGLRHAVITSVDRDDLPDDDLPDYGAHAFVGVIRQIRKQAAKCQVGVRSPDFRGEEMPPAKVSSERPDVFNRKVEVGPLPVVRYWHSDDFTALEHAAYTLGFEHVAEGPLVRSIYHAGQHVPQQEPGIGPVGRAACIGAVAR